jgi:hypothetical protein
MGYQKSVTRKKLWLPEFRDIKVSLERGVDHHTDLSIYPCATDPRLLGERLAVQVRHEERIEPHGSDSPCLELVVLLKLLLGRILQGINQHLHRVFTPPFEKVQIDFAVFLGGMHTDPEPRSFVVRVLLDLVVEFIGQMLACFLYLFHVGVGEGEQWHVCRGSDKGLRSVERQKNEIIQLNFKC